MSLTQLLSLPCTIERRTDSGTTDRYGSPKASVVEVETVCELQQRSRDEPDDQGELSATDWRLYLPAGTDIDTSDKVIVDGITFEVVGDPWQTRNPRTSLQHHVEASLRKTGDTQVAP